MYESKVTRLLKGAVNERTIEEALELVKAEMPDDEACHSLEDDLWSGLLLAMAESRCAVPAICARMALKTKELDFARWCA